MTEKEKMQRQMLYDANYDKTLIEERMEAKKLCHKYNQLCPDEIDEQNLVMRKLLGKSKIIRRRI